MQQLLEAALAHHNLGSFEEALKFLEASSIQLTDVLYRNKEVLEHRKSIKVYLSPALHIETDYFDLEMYILLCKGNVYQSCGDDEQSLLHYMEAFSKAHHRVDKDWEVISFNSIGMLAYFNLRYDVALLCFHTVAIFREAVILITSYHRLIHVILPHYLFLCIRLTHYLFLCIRLPHYLLLCIALPLFMHCTITLLLFFSPLDFTTTTTLPLFMHYTTTLPLFMHCTTSFYALHYHTTSFYVSFYALDYHTTSLYVLHYLFFCIRPMESIMPIPPPRGTTRHAVSIASIKRERRD